MPQKEIYQYSMAAAAPLITAVTAMTVTADRVATTGVRVDSGDNGLKGTCVGAAV